MAIGAMRPLICLCFLWHVGVIGNLQADTVSDSDYCGDETAMTFPGWREWTGVTTKPIISAAHNNNWVGVYVDELAKDTYLAASSPYPICAKVIKPIYNDAYGASVRKLTIMVKMHSGYDPENADWWYGDYDAFGTTVRKHGKLAECITCHKQAAETDYLFSREVVTAAKE